jgi:DNA-directed RNA polymerase subunit RPC12/RpoP
MTTYRCGKCGKILIEEKEEVFYADSKDNHELCKKCYDETVFGAK